MIKLFPILFLSSLALATDREMVFTREAVFLFEGRVEVDTYDTTKFYTAKVYGAYHSGFWAWFLKNWCGGPNGPLNLKHFNQFAKVYQPWKTPEQEACEVLGISMVQYKDWLANGELRTEEQIQAEKDAEELKQVAEAVAEISNIKFYLSPDGKWHTDKDCIDNVNSIEINPFDIMRIPSVTKCEKCGTQ